MSRLELVEECKHGLMGEHEWTTTKPLEAGNWGLSGGYFPGKCPGGSRTPLDPDRILTLVTDKVSVTMTDVYTEVTVQDVLDALEETP